MTKSISRILLAVVIIGVCGTCATARPLKIFILAGQSNMQGHAHVRTFDVIGLDPFSPTQRRTVSI